MTGWEHATVVSTGLLLGWTALASTVDVAAGALQLVRLAAAAGGVAIAATGVWHGHWR